MEQHPVPQNVTTFQFRLIGDMTLKQFGYLCAGAILAFIAYKLPLPLIITWPLAGLFAFLGVGFAFIPVEERPMDVWVFSFFRSIYSPTQYIWSNNAPTTTPSAVPPASTAPQPVTVQKNPATATTAPIPPTPTSSAPAKKVLSGIFQHKNPPHQEGAQELRKSSPTRSNSFLDEIASLFHPKQFPSQNPSHPTQTSVSTITPPTSHTPPPSSRSQQPSQQSSSEPLHQKLAQLEETVHTLQARLTQKSVTEERVLELQKQLTEVMRQKSLSEEELISLKRKLAPTQAAPPQEIPHGKVNVISSQEAAVKVGLPRLTNTPNVITGIVKDDAGNFLPGILVTVTNQEGVPVRALKTNKLGQFAASTPLTNGTYFIEIEDPRGRFTFSRVQLTLTGVVVPVIEIIAKSEKMLTREKLAQELFGGHS